MVNNIEIVVNESTYKVSYLSVSNDYGRTITVNPIDNLTDFEFSFDISTQGIVHNVVGELDNNQIDISTLIRNEMILNQQLDVPSGNGLCP